MTRETFHVAIGNTVRFISTSGNDYTGEVVKIQEFPGSFTGNLITVQTDKGYRNFYEGERLHEVL